MNCDHPGCGCSGATLERDGRHYCSESCARQATEGGSGACDCGHADCS
jgi:hypothetical protein